MGLGWREDAWDSGRALRFRVAEILLVQVRGAVFSEGGVGGSRQALKDQWKSLGWNVTPVVTWHHELLGPLLRGKQGSRNESLKNYSGCWETDLGWTSLSPGSCLLLRELK